MSHNKTVKRPTKKKHNNKNEQKHKMNKNTTKTKKH